MPAIHVGTAAFLINACASIILSVQLASKPAQTAGYFEAELVLDDSHACLRSNTYYLLLEGLDSRHTRLEW